MGDRPSMHRLLGTQSGRCPSETNVSFACSVFFMAKLRCSLCLPSLRTSKDPLWNPSPSDPRLELQSSLAQVRSERCLRRVSCAPCLPTYTLWLKSLEPDRSSWCPNCRICSSNRTNTFISCRLPKQLFALSILSFPAGFGLSFRV